MRIRKTRALAIGALALALAGISTTPAHAVPAPDGVSQVLALAGSDTTEDVMDALSAAYTADRGHNPDPGHDRSVNIPVQAVAGSTPFDVPADDDTAARVYVNKNEAAPPNTYPAPNGSTDGKNALRGVAPFPTDNLSTAAIDIARSSSGRSSSDPAQFEFYGFGLDAVSWGHYNGAAPDSLTISQVRGIYACTITNWNQVGGSNAPIRRFIPQAGSGTRSFFIGTVLNGAQPSTSCGSVTEVQEHDGRAVPPADRFYAIVPYSVAQWVAQANNVVEDKRGGALIGHQSGQNPVAGPDADGKYSPNAAVVNENASFVGVRPVYNVLDSRISSHGQALRFVGEDSDGPGYLCDGNAEVQDILTRYGFSPFEADPISGSTCRVA